MKEKIIEFIHNHCIDRPLEFFDGMWSRQSLVGKNSIYLAQQIFTFLMPAGIKVDIKYSYDLPKGVVTLINIDVSETNG